MYSRPVKAANRKFLTIELEEATDCCCLANRYSVKRNCSGVMNLAGCPKSFNNVERSSSHG